MDRHMFRTALPDSLRVVVVAALLALAPSVLAQELEIAVSPTPVGSGARAAGMADAFVAIADDATAASWNPAGLVQLERPEISVVGSFNAVFEEFSAPWHPELKGEQDVSNYDLNYLSVAYPLPFLVLGRNAIVSLNYQRKYDFSRDFVTDYNKAYVTSQRPLLLYKQWDFKQDGGLSTLTPAFAIELTHRLSVGVAVNFWRSSLLSENGWDQSIRRESVNFAGSWMTYRQKETTESYSDFSGENFTLGLLWNPNDRWSIGLRYDTAFTGEVDYELKEWTIYTGFINDLDVVASVRKHKRHVRFPDTLALGAAFRPTDRLTLALDIARTDWNDFYVKDNNGNRRSLVDFSDQNEPLTRSRFDPTYTVRFGLEYVLLPKEPRETMPHLWTLRGGLFYDQEPASGRELDGFHWPGDVGDGDPDDFYGLAAGVGLQLWQRVNIDFAYQLRYGNDVNSDFIRGVTGFSEDVLQHRALLSTVIYF